MSFSHLAAVVEVVPSVVLDGDPPVGIAEVGSGDPPAVAVDDVAVDVRLRQAGVRSTCRTNDSIGESTAGRTCGS